ncbi:MAG: hypothetical protein ABIQ27_07125 [Flavobacterium sp.]|uniref:hypothetical protein n=1 Tax=Flavobacterium sp. TaxID=239 RepID=UPI0032642996
MERQRTFNELTIAHQELLLHLQELEKCNRELVTANKHLKDSNNKTETQTAALNTANKKIIVETALKNERTAELKIANTKLLNAETGLNEIAFAISHRIRKAVANILGIAYHLIDDETMTPEETKEMTNIIIQSANSLNLYTEELAKSLYSKRESS